ncbi:hypothetical protein HQ865_16405 [Mucilaginibacter mali]|uniref:Uncharacterized protein n=1 Tax=Mucilaginibacter mali TaxID=2740462 RepID=A0A7D4QGP9_9SPHI|nr:hypothetical protein [Mucilaginibacter mali]QKJ31272.1 hypothetical protein HQ865_16405 [Mucilaginibacter mali]
MLKDLTIKQELLAQLMSDISEKYYAAGWAQDLEYVLWDAVINGERKYGHDIITIREIETLISLSNEAKCWIVFDDHAEETAISLEVWRKKFNNDISNNAKLLNS